MSSLIYFRLVGYAVTVVMHVSNFYVMQVSIKSSNVTADALEDAGIRTFKSMELRYLTTWTVSHEVGYAMLGILCDTLVLLNRNKKNFKLPSFLTSFRSFIFPSVIWPATMVVSTVFWSLYLYDRSLVFPDYLDRIISKTSNHLLHTAIVPVALWEMVFRPRREPKSHLGNILLLATYILTYGFVLHYTYHEVGVWLYPIVGVLSGIYFPLFHVLIAALAYFFYFAHWKLCNFIHREKSSKKVK